MNDKVFANWAAYYLACLMDFGVSEDEAYQPQFGERSFETLLNLPRQVLTVELTRRGLHASQIRKCCETICDDGEWQIVAAWIERTKGNSSDDLILIVDQDTFIGAFDPRDDWDGLTIRRRMRRS